MRSTLLICLSHALSLSHSLWFFLSSFCSYKTRVWQLDFFSWSGSVPVPCPWTLLQRRSSPKQHVEIIDYRQNKDYKPHQECTSPVFSVFFYYPDAHTVWGFHPHLTYLVSEPGSTSLMSSKGWKNLERKPSKERLSSISFKECCLLGHIWKAAQCRWAELCPVAKERCHAWAAPCES